MSITSDKFEHDMSNWIFEKSEGALKSICDILEILNKYDNKIFEKILNVTDKGIIRLNFSSALNYITKLYQFGFLKLFYLFQNL